MKVSIEFMKTLNKSKYRTSAVLVALVNVIRKDVVEITILLGLRCTSHMTHRRHSES